MLKNSKRNSRKSKCVIICNGKINDYKYMRKYLKDAFILCADGGTNHCKDLKVTPDLIIGDLDSADSKVLRKYKNIERVEYPTHKDFTDTELALEYAMERFKDIVLIGALGGRFDHSISNAYLLTNSLKKDDVKIEMVNERNIIQVCDKDIIIEKEQMKYISFVPVSEEVIFETSYGLKYPLDGVILQKEKAVGVSNEILTTECFVKVKKGTFWIIHSNDI